MLDGAVLSVVELISLIPPGSQAAVLLSSILPEVIVQPVEQVRTLGAALLDARGDRSDLDPLRDLLGTATAIIAVQRRPEATTVRVALSSGGSALVLTFGENERVTAVEHKPTETVEALFADIPSTADFAVTWSRAAHTESSGLRLLENRLQSSWGADAAVDPGERAEVVSAVKAQLESIVSATPSGHRE